MNSFNLYIDIEDKRWTAAMADIAAVAQHVKAAVIEKVVPDLPFMDGDKDFSVNLCLSDDASVHQLNAEFRGMDKPTNVLSFANIDDDEFEDMLDSGEVIELGDIIIAYETMVREAEEQGVSLHDHFCHLWAHGLLHILGFDHQTTDEAAEMEGLETEVLAVLKIADPYRE